MASDLQDISRLFARQCQTEQAKEGGESRDRSIFSGLIARHRAALFLNGANGSEMRRESL